MKAAFLIWIIAAWTIERFTTQSRGSSASLLLHQLYNNGFNSLSGLKAHYFHSKYKSRTYNCHDFNLQNHIFSLFLDFK